MANESSVKLESSGGGMVVVGVVVVGEVVGGVDGRF